MELQPLCTNTRPGGLTTVNQFTGLNGCLNSCKNGLRATFWANTAVSPFFAHSTHRLAHDSCPTGEQLFLRLSIPHELRQRCDMWSEFVLRE